MGRAVLHTTATTARPYVSKSKFLWGHQCKKLLWYAYNAKDQIPEPDATQQAIFDQGHEVGALAKSFYPGGIEVSAGVTDFQQVLQKTLEAAKARKPLFEAGFLYNGGFARVDILNPVGKDEWDIIEVKSAPEVKDVNLLDLAFQAFVYNGAGLSIRRCCVMCVDREYVRRGVVDAKKFFKVVDVTKEVFGLSREIEPQLEDLFSVIGASRSRRSRSARTAPIPIRARYRTSAGASCQRAACLICTTAVKSAGVYSKLGSSA